MNKSKCGIDCESCELNKTCKGCLETNGNPFGGECVISKCCDINDKKFCSECSANLCSMKNKIIDEFNDLSIPGLPKIKDLNALQGAFVNVEYTLPSGQKIKIWNDDKIYLGNQLKKKNSKRCFGLTADENYLLVCEYGENGANAELVAFVRRK